MSCLKVIDLTHIIHEDITVFPGTEKPILKTAYTVEKDGYRETKMTMYSHTGTHVDAPAHMLSQGIYLDDLAIDKFIGKATMLDFSNKNISSIDVEDLKSFEDKINKVEFIIIKTGWSNFWGSERYYEPFPALTSAAAKWLTKFRLKGIGLDTISIDHIKTTEFLVHKTLLQKNILIIENLTNLDCIKNEFFILSAMPLKTKEADGAPVRAVAIEDF